jgi:hypothetical protein
MAIKKEELKEDVDMKEEAARQSGPRSSPDDVIN